MPRPSAPRRSRRLAATRPAPALAATGLIALTGLMAGCQPQGEVDRYRTQYRTAETQILDLQARLEDKQREVEVLRGAKNPNLDLRNQLSGAQEESASLQAEIDRLRELIERAGTTPIPIELADELEKLAEANPDLMSYDTATGAIRFRSDVTFGLGKAEVRRQAVPIINKLAQVLQAPVAEDYEVRVAGHTDNVPMKNAMNRQKYGNNWGLSVARAISVMQAFAAAGVPETRMSVAGYGEFRPVVPNGDTGNEQNRRVEIFLTPLPGALAAEANAGGSGAAGGGGGEDPDDAAALNDARVITELDDVSAPPADAMPGANK